VATKRDLVEAHGFSRRRLVTAFVSGAPGGREVEPSRPGRAIIGGVALTVLVLAAAAVVGFLKPRPDEGWADNQGMVIAEETGEQYIVQPDEDGGDTVLLPVVNTTSARLILGDELSPTTVPQEDIDEYDIVDAIGILGAPTSVPSASRLVDDGWTACTGDSQGLRLSLADSPGAQPDLQSSILVQSGGFFHLLAYGELDAQGQPQVFRMQVGAEDGGVIDQLLGAIGNQLSRDAAIEVPSTWLSLFPAAPPLLPDSIDVGEDLARRGQPIAAGVQLEGGVVPRVGMVVEQPNGERVVLTDESYNLLSPFAADVQVALAGQDQVPVVASTTLARGAAAYPSEWPDERPASTSSESSVCAVLHTGASGVAARVGLAFFPDETASAEGLEATQQEARVQRARGAVVRSGGFGATPPGSAFLVDAQGMRYELAGNAINLLGYDVGDTPVVPDTWMAPFNCGVVLAREEALKTLSSDRQEELSCEPPSPEDEAAAAGAGG